MAPFRSAVADRRSLDVMPTKSLIGQTLIIFEIGLLDVWGK